MLKSSEMSRDAIDQIPSHHKESIYILVRQISSKISSHGYSQKKVFQSSSIAYLETCLEAYEWTSQNESTLLITFSKDEETIGTL